MDDTLSDLVLVKNLSIQIHKIYIFKLLIDAYPSLLFFKKTRG